MKKIITSLALIFAALNANAGNVLQEEYKTFAYWEGCWASNKAKQIDIMGLYESSFPYEFNGYKFYGEYVCDSNYTKQILVQNITPQANFTILSQEPRWSGGKNRVKIASTSTDADGEVMSYKWWVNGTLKGETGPILTMTTFLGGDYTIKLEVIDNGVLEIDLDTEQWLNNKERYFHQKDKRTKVITLMPFSCDATCHLD